MLVHAPNPWRGWDGARVPLCRAVCGRGSGVAWELGEVTCEACTSRLARRPGLRRRIRDARQVRLFS